MVELRDVRKTFRQGESDVVALAGVTFDVPAGQFLSIMGPSGSGKSTLLHLIGGLDAPSAGSVRVGGSDLGRLDDNALTLLRRRRIGFVFQAFNLIDVLSAEENVALPLIIDGVREGAAQKRAGSVL